MTLPLKLNPAADAPLQTQIFEQVQRMIFDGSLKPGTPLPATRILSEQAGVSRNTVVLAYERLMAEGYIESRRSVGTFVSTCLPEDSLLLDGPPLPANGNRHELAEPAPVRFKGRAPTVVNPNRRSLVCDFWVGRPDPRSFPIKAWRRILLRKLAASGTNLTEYRDPGGLFELRQAIADYLGPTRGIIAEPEQIVITSGSQDGLNLVARLLVREGTPVVIEQPSYQGAAYLFESCGGRLLGVPVDGRGLDPTQLPEVREGLAYVTPSHQYPLGVTLALGRRIRLLDWAAKGGNYVVEDDYDSDFRYQGAPLTALKGLDRMGSVIYLGTFSKSIGAGLRIGYMVLPPHLAEVGRTAKALMNNGQPWLEQAVLAEFISSGAFDRHLRRIRRSYMQRRDCLIEALTRHFGEVDVSGGEGGMHIVWRLPRGFPAADEVRKLALSVGVGVYTLGSGAAYELPGQGLGEEIVILGYSSLNEREIVRGIERLADVLPQSAAANSKSHRRPVTPCRPCAIGAVGGTS